MHAAAKVQPGYSELPSGDTNTSTEPMKRRNGLVSRLFPFLGWWPMVSRRTLRGDLVAGLTGALIVLPQGVAFATIAGLPPQYGLYAAMMPAVIGALWGSSWHLVSGPTTAISIAVFAALSGLAEPGSTQYINLVLTLTFLVGVFELALGLARMGALVNFISHSVVIGFTAGAAVLIAASQVRNFFGIRIPRGTPFYEIVHQLLVQIGEVNAYVLCVGAVTLAVGILTKRYVPRVPYMIAAMIVGSLVAEAFNYTLGADFTGIVTVGALPATLPPLSMPDFSAATLRQALAPALVITMLALTEAVSIARAIAVRSEQRVDGNQEFIGQGLSNIVGAFFSAYASSGSFNRSGVNYEAGAQTPLASIIASLFLLLVLFLVAPLAAYLPTAAMAGILFLVAWGLIDFHHIHSIWGASKAEFLILGATLVGTLVNLEAGIFIGVFLSLLMFLYRTSRPEVIPVVPAPEEGAYHFVRAQGRPECKQMRIVRVNGALYFGAASYLQQVLQQIDENNPLQKNVLIAAAGISYIDIAGAEVLAQEARRRRRLGGGLYFYRLNRGVHDFLKRGGYATDIGDGAFFPVMTDVTGALYWTLDPDVCRSCKPRIFAQCNKGLLPDGLRRQRLMLATDGSACARAPSEIAIALAQRYGVTLDVMTAVDAAANKAEGSERLALVSRAALVAGVDCEEILSLGKAGDQAVVAAARQANANILVIGCQPARGLKEKLLGDVASRIVAQAPSHVLVVAPQARMWTQRIVFVSDISEASDVAAEFAGQIARVTRTPITVLAFATSDKEEAAQREDAGHKAALMKLDGALAEARIMRAPAGAALAAVVEELGADLVIVRLPRRGGIERLLGDRVIGAVACAVLVFKSGEAADSQPALRDQS